MDRMGDDPQPCPAFFRFRALQKLLVRFLKFFAFGYQVKNIFGLFHFVKLKIETTKNIEHHTKNTRLLVFVVRIGKWIGKSLFTFSFSFLVLFLQ